MKKPLLTLVLAAAAACATASPKVPAPLSIGFGQDLYLTDTFLGSAPGSRCGPPVYAPGGIEAGGDLPDGSWFRLFAMEATDGTLDTVVLERGWQGRDAQMVLRLDGQEGIVRLRDRERTDAWGIYHPWADWLRTIGGRALRLECASSR